MYNFLVSNFLEFRATLIDAIKAKKPLIGQTPFELTSKDINDPKDARRSQPNFVWNEDLNFF